MIYIGKLGIYFYLRLANFINFGFCWGKDRSARTISFHLINPIHPKYWRFRHLVSIIGPDEDLHQIDIGPLLTIVWTKRIK